MKLIAAVFFAVLTSAAVAQEPPPVEFVEVPPPPPAIINSDDVDAEEFDGIEPEVTIIRKEDATHEEYRHNGRLFMVKVIPNVGKPYYFVDRDGDGVMDTRMNDRAWQVQVPQWVIFSW